MIARLMPFRAVVVMLVLTLVVIAERARTYDEPFENDVAGYAVIAHEWMGGRSLYTDLWERKPPLLYATFAAAERVFGYGRGAVFAVNATAAVAILWAVYLAASAGGGPVAGGIAAGLWAIVGGDLWAQANQPNGELFVNACLTPAVALLLAWPTRRRWVAAVAVGALFAAATLYKHHVIVTCVALAVGHVITRRPAARRVGEMTVAFAVVAVAWAGLFAAFASVGHLGPMVDVLVHQNAGYAGGLLHNLAAALSPGLVFRPAMEWAIGPTVLLAGWLIFAARRGAAGAGRASWGLWIAWVVGAWPAVALPGQFFGHYYQYWLPVACVGGGWAAAGLLAAKPRLVAPLRWGLVTLGLAIPLYHDGWPYLHLTVDGWADEKYPGGNYVQQKYLGRYLPRHLLKPNERFWVAGDDTSLYFESRQSPLTGLLYVDPMTTGDATAAFNRRLVDDLARHPPDLVLLSPLILRFPQDAPIHPWLAAHYVPWLNPLGGRAYHLMVRRGSDLARRLGIASATVPTTSP